MTKDCSTQNSREQDMDTVCNVLYMHLQTKKSDKGNDVCESFCQNPSEASLGLSFLLCTVCTALLSLPVPAPL